MLEEKLNALIIENLKLKQEIEKLKRQIEMLLKQLPRD